MAQLQQSDLTYLGAFRLPKGSQGSGLSDGFAYGGNAVAYNPANNSLFIDGHDAYGIVAEIAIPQIVNSSNLALLKTATVLQQFKDATEGKFHQLDTGSGVRVGGLMVSGGKLYMTFYDFYDATNQQVLTHFSRPLNLTTTGQVAGPFGLETKGTIRGGFVSGWMLPIPQAWQSRLGGPFITGNGCLNIIGRTSWGPSAFAFDVANLGVINPAPDVPLVYYYSEHPTLGRNYDTNETFNGTTAIHGVVFPQGFDTILYFGRHGTGTYCYGGGAACGDPVDGNQGSHAYPYRYQIWAYDANDLAEVKAGTKNPWDVVPYAIWPLTLRPAQNENLQLGGAGYDPVTRNIYLIQRNAEQYGMPLMHVFKHREAQMPKTINVSTTINTVPGGTFKVRTQLLDSSDVVIDDATSAPISVPADPPSTPNVETPVATVS